GAIEWFDGYRISNQTGYLYDMVKWGTDWLIAAHPKPDQLFIQVGSTQVDNSHWGPDTNLSYPRPAYDINSTAHGTDIAAETAAAFASSAILFRDFLNDTAYAKTLIAHAISVYNFSELQTLVLATTSVPESRGYRTSTFYDKLVYGALWLYRATNQPQYLTKAVNYYNIGRLQNSSRVMSWDDQTGGLLWCGDSQAASLPIALYGAFGYLMYSSYATTVEKTNAYKNFVTSQINYLFGDNPMKMFYVVAVHPNSPKNPHHAGAHGGTNVANLSDPVNTKYPLYGAVVGGPSQNDSYEDSRANVDQSEVALDYNSAYQGIMAYYVIDTYVPPPNLPNPEGPTGPTSIFNALPQNHKLIIITVRDPEKNNQGIKSVDVKKDNKNIESELSKHSENDSQNTISELSKQCEKANHNTFSESGPLEQSEKDNQDTESKPLKQSEKDNQAFESEPLEQSEINNQDSENEPLKQFEINNQDSENEPSRQSEKDNQDSESEPSKQSEKDNQNSEREPSKQSEKDNQDSENEPSRQSEKDNQDSESEPSKQSEKDNQNSEREPSKQSEKDNQDSENEPSRQSEKDNQDSESEPSKQSEKDSKDSENELLKQHTSENNTSNDTVV
ncbi:1525_t:CDS:2, partial [Racocetra fulgida]